MNIDLSFHITRFVTDNETSKHSKCVFFCMNRKTFAFTLGFLP